MSRMLRRINYEEHTKLEHLLDALESYKANAKANNGSRTRVVYGVEKLFRVPKKIVENNSNIVEASRFELYNFFKVGESFRRVIEDVDAMWIVWLKMTDGTICPSILMDSETSVGDETTKLLSVDNNGDIVTVWEINSIPSKPEMMNSMVDLVMGKEDVKSKTLNFSPEFNSKFDFDTRIKVMSNAYMRHEDNDECTTYSETNRRLDVCSKSYISSDSCICHPGKYVIVPQPTGPDANKNIMYYNTRTVREMLENKESFSRVFDKMVVDTGTINKSDDELKDIYQQIIREFDNINSTFMIKAKYFIENTAAVNVPIMNYLGFIVLAKEFECVLLKRRICIKDFNEDYLSKLDRAMVNHINTSLFLGKTNLQLKTNRSLATAYCRYANIVANMIDGFITRDDILLESNGNTSKRKVEQLILERDNLLMLSNITPDLLSMNDKHIIESVSELAMRFMDTKDPNIKARVNFILENEMLVINRNKNIDKVYLENLFDIDDIINSEVYMEGVIGDFTKKVSKVVANGTEKVKDSIIDMIASRGGKVKEAFADLENERDASIRDDAINNKLFPQLDKMVNLLAAAGVGLGAYVLLGPVFGAIAALAVYIIKDNRTEKNYKRAMRLFEDEETIIDKKIELATMKNDDKAIIALMRAKQKLARVRKRTEIDMKEHDIHVHVDSDV